MSNSGTTSYVACHIRAGHTAAVWQRGGGLGGWAARTVDASLGRIHAGRWLYRLGGFFFVGWAAVRTGGAEGQVWLMSGPMGYRRSLFLR